MGNILSIGQLSKKQIEEILSVSIDLEQNGGTTLKNKNIIFAFEKPSLRTVIATEVAINHLQGHVIHIKPENFFEGQILFSNKKQAHMKGRESLKDTVKNVSEWCDAIFARVFSHQTLLDIAEHSSIPIVNALSDLHHPMQAFADLFTIQEKFGKNAVSLAYVGDANNVAFSLFEIMLMFGHDVRFAGPKNYSFSKKQQTYFEKVAVKNHARVFFTDDPKEAVEHADVVYTDTFVSMGEEQEYEEKIKAFGGYQVNKKLFSRAKKGAIFMHCLPAHRGVEVTDEIIDSKMSLVYQQAKNRMVVSKGVFTTLLQKKI
ncbi:ornithine carbamoyltransferase [Candidatus Uhrbacteria bacterium]|nr:ornithine carbamoyltransferase [Candidatus Uhrbacteria bacterium]